MPFTKEEIEKTRLALPKGSYAKIAASLQLSHGTVKNVFTGTSNNEAVILAGLELIEEQQKMVHLAKSKIAAL